MNYKMKFSVRIRSVFFILFAFIVSSNILRGQSIRDIDGNEYKIARLGIQQWISSNLNVSRFRNGDVIPEAKTEEEWIKAGKSSSPAWCYYNNDPKNGSTSGRLYNWFAVNDPRGLAPEGWHVAVNSDWSTLVKNLLGIDYASPKMKSRSGWKTRNGTNDIGFSAIPGGFRDEKGAFNDLKTKARWWSNSVPVEIKPSTQIYSFVVSDDVVAVSYIKVNKEVGLSVRCIKD